MAETDEPETRDDVFRVIDLRLQLAMATLRECWLLLERLRRELVADEDHAA